MRHLSAARIMLLVLLSMGSTAFTMDGFDSTATVYSSDGDEAKPHGGDEVMLVDDVLLGKVLRTFFSQQDIVYYYDPKKERRDLEKERAYLRRERVLRGIEEVHMSKEEEVDKKKLTLVEELRVCVRNLHHSYAHDLLRYATILHKLCLRSLQHGNSMVLSALAKAFKENIVVEFCDDTWFTILNNMRFDEKNSPLTRNMASCIFFSCSLGCFDSYEKGVRYLCLAVRENDDAILLEALLQAGLNPNFRLNLVDDASRGEVVVATISFLDEVRQNGHDALAEVLVKYGAAVTPPC